MVVLVTTKAVAQQDRAVFEALYDRSTQLITQGASNSHGKFVDSLIRVSDRSTDFRYFAFLIKARHLRHNGQLRNAYGLLDSLSMITGHADSYFAYLNHYQQAKTLQDLEVYDRSRSQAQLASAAALRAGLKGEASQMELTVCEVDLHADRLTEAQQCFERSLQASLAEERYGEASRALIGMGNVYYFQELDTTALRYYTEALRFAQKVQDPGLMVSVLLNIGAALSYTDGPDTAIALYRHVLDTASTDRLPARWRADILGNLASIYTDLEQHGRAQQLLDSALALYGPLNDTASMAQIHLYRSTANAALGQVKDALADALIARAWTRSTALKADATKKAAEHLRALGRDREALDLYVDHLMLADSVARTRYNNGVASAQVRFETAQKDHRIAEQTQALALAAAEDRRKNIQRIALGISALTVTIIALLLARSLRNRRRLAEQERKLHAQQVDELLKRSEIDALNAMMEGQEKERDRVARDLHDRLGSMLSAIKHQIDGLDADVQGLQVEQRGHYTKVNRMLDEAVGEVRRISHDMVSVTLARFGLEKALEDLCDSVRLNGRLAVELSLFGMEQRMERGLEITVYRIVQELVSNVLKHADAHELSISVTRGPGRISVIVADDGRGFDTSAAADGIGLSNVRARAAAMGAQVIVNSAIGKGTTVSIEGPVVE